MTATWELILLFLIFMTMFDNVHNKKVNTQSAWGGALLAPEMPPLWCSLLRDSSFRADNTGASQSSCTTLSRG